MSFLEILHNGDDGVQYNALPFWQGGIFYFFGLPLSVLGIIVSFLRSQKNEKEWPLRAFFFCAVLCAALIWYNLPDRTEAEEKKEGVDSRPVVSQTAENADAGTEAAGEEAAAAGTAVKNAETEAAATAGTEAEEGAAAAVETEAEEKAAAAWNSVRRDPPLLHRHV